MSEELTFLPRKLMQARKKSITSTKKHNVDSIITTGKSTSSRPIKELVHEEKERDEVGEEHGKSPMGNLPHKEKVLDDGAYTSLLELALSDYAIWKDKYLTELMNDSETEGCK